MRVDTAKIKALRLKKELSMRQAAELAGWKTSQQWLAIENGRSKNPRIQTVSAVARVLGCKARQLLKEE